MDEQTGKPAAGEDDLRDKLERLHEELSRTESVDEETKVLLQDLMEHTQKLLDHEGEEITPHYVSLNERLVAEVARFEGTHPDLAYVMAKVIDTLSGLGI